MGDLFSLCILLSLSSLRAAEAPSPSPPTLPQSRSQHTFDPYSEESEETIAPSISSFDEAGYDRKTIRMDAKANIIINQLAQSIESKTISL